jgi:hypothetical protein
LVAHLSGQSGVCAGASADLIGAPKKSGAPKRPDSLSLDGDVREETYAYNE